VLACRCYLLEKEAAGFTKALEKAERARADAQQALLAERADKEGQLAQGAVWSLGEVVGGHRWDRFHGRPRRALCDATCGGTCGAGPW
jgi:hypothetical protein